MGLLDPGAKSNVFVHQLTGKNSHLRATYGSSASPSMLSDVNLCCPYSSLHADSNTLLCLPTHAEDSAAARLNTQQPIHKSHLTCAVLCHQETTLEHTFFPLANDPVARSSQHVGPSTHRYRPSSGGVTHLQREQRWCFMRSTTRWRVTGLLVPCRCERLLLKHTRSYET